ncbi:MAG: hypothetical protein QM656_07270 [Paracoccaceae bacterium]
MMLIEETAVPDAALPVQALKDHLRLGTGFADAGLQDALLASHLRAALAAIEGRTGKALLARRFRLELAGWRDGQGQALPVAPVGAVVSVTVRDRDGAGVVVDTGRYRLMADAHRPRLMAVGLLLPDVPEGGKAEVVFEAGFGSDWQGVPADLAQAVLLLAAEFYERRHDGGQAAGLPFGVQVLIERWRTVRVLGGGR